MLEGVPRALNAPAECSVLNGLVGRGQQRKITTSSSLILQNLSQIRILELSIPTSRFAKYTRFNQCIIVDKQWKPTLQ